jgi:hypothetical protein
VGFEGSQVQNKASPGSGVLGGEEIASVQWKAASTNERPDSNVSGSDPHCHCDLKQVGPYRTQCDTNFRAKNNRLFGSPSKTILAAKIILATLS